MPTNIAHSHLPSLAKSVRRRQTEACRIPQSICFLHLRSASRRLSASFSAGHNFIIQHNVNMAEPNLSKEQGASRKRPQKRSHSSISMPPPASPGDVEVTATSGTTFQNEDKGSGTAQPVPEPTKEELYEQAKARKIVRYSDTQFAKFMLTQHRQPSPPVTPT